MMNCRVRGERRFSYSCFPLVQSVNQGFRGLLEGLCSASSVRSICVARLAVWTHGPAPRRFGKDNDSVKFREPPLALPSE